MLLLLLLLLLHAGPLQALMRLGAQPCFSMLRQDTAA